MMKLFTQLSIFLAVFFMTACGSDETVQEDIIRPVKAMTIGSAAEMASQGFPATTIASQDADLSFKEGGPLVKLNVIEGKKVLKGALIAELDARDYILDEQSAKARYTQTKAEAERYKRLLNKGAVAKSDYDRKQANYLQAKAHWEDAKNNLKDTKLYAPFDGYYGPKLVEVGEEIKKDQRITTLSNLDIIEVTTTIPEQVAIKLKNFKSFEVHFDVYPNQVFNATLKDMGKVPTAEGYPLHLYLDHVNDSSNPDQDKVSAGMSCRVNINLSEDNDKSSALIIPSIAVFEKDTASSPSVWILEKAGNGNYTVKSQSVKLDGFADRDYVKVASGLQTGQQIVVAGAKRLVEGMEVKILDPKAFN